MSRQWGRVSFLRTWQWIQRVVFGKSLGSSQTQEWTRKKKGDWGEKEAARFLESKGFRILGKNIRMKGGEIDLLADDDGTLVFVEVKTRWEPSRNPPLLAVDNEKLAHLRRAGREYLRRIRPPHPPARIDLIGVAPKESGSGSNVMHLAGAAWLSAGPRDPAP